MEDEDKRNLASAAWSFIVLMAVVSLFNDMTFEGANSILGSYESFLGMPTMVLTALAGVATLLGCSLRMLFAILSDKTGKYWLFVLLGYAIDMISVPLLALVPDGGWPLAVIFVLSEKVGKAIKKPAKSALVSFASKQKGAGKSFAIGEALDQIGACLGPLLLSVTFLFTGDKAVLDQYRIGFWMLGIPAFACLTLLLVARVRYPKPENFERSEGKEQIGPFIKSKAFLLFVLGAAIFAAGYMDSFSLMNKSLAERSILPIEYLPLLYGYAMFIDALAALAFGYLFDKIGFYSIAIAALLSAPYALCIFVSDSLAVIFLGLTAWGMGMGAMESVLLSGVSALSQKNERARAYGFFELFFGLSSFGFSFLIAYLYDTTKLGLGLFSAGMVVLGSLFFFFCNPLRKQAGNAE